MLFVESAQSAPGGPLFSDVQAGGAFRPDATVDRLTAALALVRAAGLQSEAESKNLEPLNFTDAASIPSNLRGYVAVATQRGLIQTDGTAFRPQDGWTRADLAHALAVMSRILNG
jgi:hypothetical protein